MSASISWTDANGQLQLIAVDAVLSEQHSAEADVTEDPVESGAGVTDNIRAKSRTLSLEVFVSDNFKNDTGEVTFQLGRAARIYAWFESFERESTLLNVTLGEQSRNGFARTYTSMAVVSARTSRSVKESNGLTIALSLKEIRLVDSKIVAAQRAKEPKGKSKASTGDKKTSPVTPEARSTSTLKNIKDSLGGLFQ